MTENVRRAGEVARLFAEAGVVAVVPLISPYRAGRDRARAVHEAAARRARDDFIFIFGETDRQRESPTAFIDFLLFQ